MGLVAPDLAAVHVPHKPHAEAVQVLRSQFVKDRPTRISHAQTETVAWSSNSVCVVPAGYPKPAIPY